MNKLIALLGFLLCLILVSAEAHSATRPEAIQVKLHQGYHSAIPASDLLSQRWQSLLSGTLVASDLDTLDDPANDPSPNFGSAVLSTVVVFLNLIFEQGREIITNFSALPQLSEWFHQQFNDPKLSTRWSAVGNDFLTILGPILLGVLLLEFLLVPVRKSLRLRQPTDLPGRITILLMLFLLRAIPILVFIGAAVTLTDHGEPQKFPHFVIVNFVYAVSLGRILMALYRGLLAPNVETLRLFPVTSKQATYAYLWLSVFSSILVAGYFFLDVARAAHIPESAITVFANIVGLILITLSILVIARIRHTIRIFLRGPQITNALDRSWFMSLRYWVAHSWHILAILYLVLGYAITALDVSNGFVIMLRGTILTLVIFVTTHFLLRAVSGFGQGRPTSGLSLHRDLLRFLFKVSIWVLASVAIATAWGADLSFVLSSPLGKRITGSAFSVLTTIFVLALVYEGISILIERQLEQSMENGFETNVYARKRTLLPMLRNTLFFVFALACVLVALSEAGFNIAPLLAGAGVVGVAIGFGSQTLVKDFLTGLFIVVENTIAIGDYVKIGDHTGFVEAMSIRTLRLRDNDGNLHIMPFSDVSSIVNMTRDYAYAVIKVGVAYNTDLDKAMNVMRSVCEDLQNTPNYGSLILAPIDILGVENLGDYAISLYARIKTRPAMQWDIRRQYLLRIKMAFDKEHIELPYPTVVSIPRKPAEP